MEKKYILTDESIIHEGKTLYKIKALKDFSDVKKDNLGGFIESYNNLSQEGNCWVYGNSFVYDNAKVLEDAMVYINSEIFGNATICKKAFTFNSKIYGDAKISDNVEIWSSKVFGNSKICSSSRIYNSKIYGNAKIFLTLECESQKINGDICLNANITKNSDIYVPEDKCHLNGDITFFKDTNSNVCINLKWFKGTIDEFKDTMHSLSLNKSTIDKYLRLIKEAENHIKV